MKLNPKLIELIDKTWSNPDDKDCALTYAACVELNTIMTLYKWGVFKTQADEYKFRILFVDEDPNNGTTARKYVLKIPLWVNEVEEDLYDEYYKSLVKSPKMVMHKGRLVNSKEGKDAFQEIQNSIKDFDLSRFVDSTINYYVKEGQYAKSLPKFLTELGVGFYESHVKTQSRLI